MKFTPRDATVPSYEVGAMQDDCLGYRISRRSLLAGALLTASAPSAAMAGMTGPPQPADVPWLDEVTRLSPPSPMPDGGSALPPLLADGPHNALIEDRSAWQARRKQLVKAWQRVLGSLPPRPQSYEYDTISSETVNGVVRRRIRYETLPGETTEAYLLSPGQETMRRQGFAVFHSTVPHSIYQPAGVKGVASKAFGWQLAKRGYAAICPRNFLWPDNDHIDTKSTMADYRRRYPHATGMARMLWEAQRAVDILAAQPGVDGRRIGAVGHSLGAKEVLYLAAFDPRVRVTVSSEGGVGMAFSNWDAPWYLGDQIKTPHFARHHHELLALVAPRPFLLIGGESADGDRSIPYVIAAQAVYRLYGEPVRLALYNHRMGHAVPPEALRRTLQWLSTYV